MGRSSPDRLLAIRRCRERREIALDLYDQLDAEPTRLDLTVSLRDDPEAVARRIRALLGVSFEDSEVAAMETAYVHCKPGGTVLFAPDHVRENFRDSTDHGGHDDGQRGLRYLEWTWDPDPADSSYVVDYAYVFRERDGSVHVELDRHVEGLFARADWFRLMREVGFEPQVVPFEHSELDSGWYEVFTGSKSVPGANNCR